MRVLYAYDGDARSWNTQSGRPRSILDQIERAGHAVIPAFPLDLRLRNAFAPHYLFWKALGRTYRPDREPAMLRSLARQVERRAARTRPDVVFSPGSHAVAALSLDVPRVFCADATFANMLEFYDSFTHCSPGYLRQGHALERRALAASAAAIFPSDWAARSAVEQYGADPARVHVVPFGANVRAPAADDVAGWIAERRVDRPRILFIGREWERKGGPIVVAACDRLRRDGLQVGLDLVGLPVPPLGLPDFVTHHGLLNKNDPDQAARLESLLAGATLLFVPSRAENYGMTFCEGAAYGLPAVATAVGGIPTIVRDHVTGRLLDAQADGDAYADAIAGMLADPAAYRAMATASRARYEDTLNWDAFGRRFLAILNDVAASPAPRAAASAPPLRPLTSGA